MPQPVPESNQVLIKVEATGLGYVDALTVAGLYQIKPRLPFIPGNEVSGIIERAGDNLILKIKREDGRVALVELTADTAFYLREYLNNALAALGMPEDP